MKAITGPNTKAVGVLVYWVARQYDQHGRRKTVYLGRANGPDQISRGAAKQLVAELERNQGKKQPATRRRVTIGDWVDSYLAERQAEGRFPQTTRSGYDECRRKLVDHFGKHATIAAVDPHAAEAFAKALRVAGLADFTVKKHVAHASTIFAAAAKRGLLASNPFAGVRTPARVEKHYGRPTLAETVAVLAATADPAVRTLVALCRYAGLRYNEARRVAWADLDAERGLLHVNRPVQGKSEAVTTKRHHRIVPMVPELRALLTQDGLAALAADYDRRLRDETLRAIAAAGMDPWPELFQAMRAMRENDWTAAGESAILVAQWMGHDVRVAKSHYVTSQPETLARITGLTAGARAGTIVSQLSYPQCNCWQAQ